MIKTTSSDADIIMYRVSRKEFDSGGTIQGRLNQVLEKQCCYQDSNWHN